MNKHCAGSTALEGDGGVGGDRGEAVALDHIDRKRAREANVSAAAARSRQSDELIAARVTNRRVGRGGEINGILEVGRRCAKIGLEGLHRHGGPAIGAGVHPGDLPGGW